MLLRPLAFDGRWQTKPSKGNIHIHIRLYAETWHYSKHHIAYGIYTHCTRCKYTQPCALRSILFRIWLRMVGKKTMTREMAFKWSSYELCQRKREIERYWNWTLMQIENQILLIIWGLWVCKKQTEDKRQKTFAQVQVIHTNQRKKKKTKSVREVVFLFGFFVMFCLAVHVFFG